jgi:hypothetical protein
MQAPAIASEVRNTFSATGTRKPGSDRMPSAKAMSVAAGMAQPEVAMGSSALTKR